jgi:hypothetical protein
MLENQLKTHPSTEDRVRRLMALADAGDRLPRPTHRRALFGEG